MKKPKVSIIIRTKNEERWISPCLKAVSSQTCKDYEIIIVDNNSTDGTLLKASQFPVKIVKIDKYLPGRSLNKGVEAAKGDILVFLSGHCIPTSQNWLEEILKGFADQKVAGVYGRQEPMNFSSPGTKRDLLIVFGLDKRVQLADSFFHNANAAIRKQVWKKHKFDNSATNIEDRLWASVVQKHGYKIIYQPGASVYHHHGIHHDGDIRRAESTVKVIEEISENLIKHKPGKINPKKMKIVGFIPVKGKGPLIDNKPILEYTLKQAKKSNLLKEVYVFTDSKDSADLALKYGAKVPFMRDKQYSKDYVSLDEVYQYCLSKIEEKGMHPDLIVTLEPTYPFRQKDLIDNMITNTLLKGYDSLLPVHAEYSSCWNETDGNHKRIDMGDLPRNLKSPILLGIKGLGCVTHPEYIRKGKLLGRNVGLIRIKDPLSFIEIRDTHKFDKGISKVLKNY